ncbi:MAG: ABC transporter permease, partial [Bacteroidota bacterium]
MWINHLRISFRKLGTHKFQSAILIGGLVIGMTSCIILLQYVSYELSFDGFHAKGDRIYRLLNERFQDGQSIQRGTITYPTIGPAMMEEFPEIKNVSRLAAAPNVMLTVNDLVEPIGSGFWVDEHFFEMFDFHLLSQDDTKLLDEPNEVMLSRELAEYFFPAVEGQFHHLIGKTVRINRVLEDFKIVGVFEDVPANSTLQFQILISYASGIRYWGEAAENSWNWSNFYHYLELEPETDVAALEAKFEGFSQRRFRGTEVSGSQEVFSLQPFFDAHLYSADLEYEIGETVNGRAVWSLLLIAFFLLMIAWINYVNLSSVRAIERSKEVGVRKVVGAGRGQLLRQFFSEALMINVISLIFALGIVQFITPWFAAQFDLDASILGFFNGHHLNVYLVLTLLALILTG